MLILGIIFYISSLVLGATVSNYLFSKYVGQKFIRFAMGVPIGFALASYITLLFEMTYGVFHQWFPLAASLIMLATSLYLYHSATPKGRRERCAAWIRKMSKELENELGEHKTLYVGILLISLVLIGMQYRGLRSTAVGIIGADNYGVDFLFHLGIGNSLIYGPFPPRFPYAAGAINVYPFIPDFYDAILISTGMGLVVPFYLMNFLLYFSIVAVGSYLFYRISKNQLLPSVAMIIFLFCGEGMGLVVMGLFNAPILQLPNSTSALLHNNPFFLITYPFFNFEMPVLNSFAPQHEYLLAFPYALTIITMLYLVFVDSAQRRPDMRTCLSLGFLVSLLPLIHPQTFIVMLLFGFVTLLYTLYKKRGPLRTESAAGLIVAAVAALPISVAELLFIRLQLSPASLINLSITYPIWYYGGASVVSLILIHAAFWLEVFGSILVVGAAGMFVMERKHLVLFVPPLIFFVVINFVWFPPGFGDSNKYTVYLIFFLALSSAVLLRRMFMLRSKYVKLLAVLLLISIIFSGVIADLNSVINAVYPIADNLSLDASSWLLGNTSPNALFATNCYRGTFDYLPSIAGRNTLLDMRTYTEPIGIYNFNIGNVSTAIDNIMQNAGCKQIRQYNISYLVVDNLDYMFGPFSCAQANYSALSSSPNLTIAARFLDPASSYNITVFRTLCGS